ncbi:phosphatase PAP2 family protein [Patescibacteria group bacterium]|nr:phosphatase PAP2 family protein [Patescibacteria group bacterium]MBU1500732.1 phosphatase PAP2 family protein [Patescibacteria group bacterium]MBU2080787.1 phosphatase PAP2 family protein [Patescibacteria group bacterium]MBU2123892.1 phosphatase PAP2 family protein [Patescibacteria group bacterium]MBU2194817.1 phosphatase PAP2 family protein [Patescibacteria group bacterium]
MSRIHATVFLGVAFLLLAFATWQFPELVRAIDVPIARFLVSHQTLTSIQLFLVITALAGVSGTVAIGLGAVYFIRKRVAYMRALVLVLAGSIISANLIKVLVARIRPEPLQWFDSLLTYSFPSGHATSAMALFGFLAFMSAQLTRGYMRVSLVTALGALVFLIGFSRLVLGVHFFSDVMGGFLLGLFWIVLCLPKKS